LTTKLVGLDDTFDLDMCKAQYGSRRARRYDPRNPCSQSVRNQNRLSSKADLEILSSFSRKAMSTKVGGNFVPYNQDIGFVLFGIRTWEIWHWQGRATKQESLDEADFMETKFPSLPRKISCKTRWSTPQGSPRA
jgi:hypothetical protein